MKQRIIKKQIATFFSIFILIGLAFDIASAETKKFETIKIKENKSRYEIDLSFPELLPGAATAHQIINSDLRKSVTENGCDEPDENSEVSHYYETTVTVAAINSHYVSFAGQFSDYCGGAHPNHGAYFMTYDAETGRRLNIEREFGFLDWENPNHDSEKEDQLRRQLAEVVVDLIPVDVDGECYGRDRQEKLQGLMNFYVSVVGLNKNKTVTVMTYPPHAAMPCQFSLNLKYKTIQHLLEKTGYLHEWLN